MKKILGTIFALGLLISAPQAHAARLFTTGFETGSVTDENLTNSNLSNPLQIATSPTRTGQDSLTLNNTITAATPNGSRYIYPAATASTTLRFYLYISSYPNANTTIAAITSTSPFNRRAYLKLTTTGSLELFDAGNSQIGSDSLPLRLNQWNRIELKHYNGVVSNTGIVEAKLNNVVFGSSSAANTASAGGSFAFGINLASESATTGSWYYDDVALNDNSGSQQNGYPGEGSVVNLYPNAAGDFAQGASSDSSAAWQDVSSRPSDGDTSYWMLQSTNDKLDVNVTDSAAAGIGTTSLITLVQTNMVVRNDGSGTSLYDFRLKARPSGTVTQSSDVDMVSSSWSLNDDGTDKTGRIVSFTDPDTGKAWTPSILDSMQIGIIAPDATPNMFITSMWATVEFTSPPRRVTFYKGRIKFTKGRIDIR